MIDSVKDPHVVLVVVIVAVIAFALGAVVMSRINEEDPR